MAVRRPPEHVIDPPDLEREPGSIMKKDTHGSCGLLKGETVTRKKRKLHGCFLMQGFGTVGRVDKFP